MKLVVQHVDGLRFLATVENHTVVVDAAPEDGGAGTALSAPQLFVAAIGACICEFVTNLVNTLACAPEVTIRFAGE